MITTGAFPKQLKGNNMAYGKKSKTLQKPNKMKKSKILGTGLISPRKRMAMKGIKKK